MSTNELALLIEIVRNISESGKTAFIWWVVGDKILPIVAWFVFSVLVCGVFAYTVLEVLKINCG